MTPPARASRPTHRPGVADRKRWRENLRGEVDGEFVYRALAAAERNAKSRDLFNRLAAAENRHAQIWRGHLGMVGDADPGPRPSARARILALLARRFGTAQVLAIVRNQEQADRAHYDAQPDAVMSGLPAEEREHAKVLTALRGAANGPAAHAENRHGGIGGNALRAAVLGVNDGLVSNLSLVMGVAGAGVARDQVLLAGFAGLLSGSLAMAMGEWLSVQSARELAARQIALESDELAEDPQGEIDELALIYESKGVGAPEARTVAEQIIRGDRQKALDTLTREELGIDPRELGGSAWVAASTSFGMFSAGAIVAVLPFVFIDGNAATVTSAAVSALALFIVGAGITVITGLNPWRAGMRQMLIGLGAAGITYAIGRLVGVTIGA